MTQPTDRRLSLRVVMMPRDTNLYGTIFGGVILSYIDQAGHAGACHATQNGGPGDSMLVTVAMDRVEFHEAVFVGEVVSLWTRVVRVGRTSITMHVEVETERDGELVKVTEAHVTYVAVQESGGDRVPVPVAGSS